ncbi:MULTISPECIES: creatininase family protein [unclassified Streptomyces]|uniref:creatininase family protein n=1 Tax=unclassified Streptomyces TaxID=2593676 RepID=UPI000DC7BE90|nr:hypothetical protein DRB89_02005 [Streptomyces sp. ICC4]AWZ17627.1 hypothetical protein DRB96_00110 [Streptomyces sp. ICC1]
MSCSHEHAALPGTASISPKTLYAVIDKIRASLARSGITKLVITNGHRLGLDAGEKVADLDHFVTNSECGLWPGRSRYRVPRRP